MSTVAALAATGRPGGASESAAEDTLEPEFRVRRLQSNLWVVRFAGHHVGIIERGRRFSTTDAQERVRTGWSTFDEARRALVEPPDGEPRCRRRLAAPAAWASALSVSVGLALGTAGLTLLR